MPTNGISMARYLTVDGKMVDRDACVCADSMTNLAMVQNSMGMNGETILQLKFKNKTVDNSPLSILQLHFQMKVRVIS